MFLASSFVALGTCLSENEKLQAGEALGFPNAQSEIVREVATWRMLLALWIQLLKD
jgi:hypothetical protein